VAAHAAARHAPIVIPQTGAAFKTDTRTELFLDPQTPGIEFVLRIATALKAKPKGCAAGM
jgi:hypothetical protein